MKKFLIILLVLTLINISLVVLTNISLESFAKPMPPVGCPACPNGASVGMDCEGTCGICASDFGANCTPPILPAVCNGFPCQQINPTNPARGCLVAFSCHLKPGNTCTNDDGCNVAGGEICQNCNCVVPAGIVVPPAEVETVRIVAPEVVEPAAVELLVAPE